MQIVAVAVVKNEIDVIEAFVRHTLAMTSRLVVLDNGSTDGTLDVLRALRTEGLALDVVQDARPGQYQSPRMTRLMHEYAVQRYSADWIVPLDADEFLVVPDGAALVPPSAGCEAPLPMRWRSYVPHPTDDGKEGNPVVRIRHRRLDERWEWHKILLPGRLASHPQAVLSHGNHRLSIAGTIVRNAAPGEAYLAHFPVRSPAQYTGKVLLQHLQHLAVGKWNGEFEGRFGAWYLAPYETIKRNPEVPDAVFREAGLRYGIPEDADGELSTVDDPMPYQGGPLRYTPSWDGRRWLWSNLLEYTERLARRHAWLESRAAGSPEESESEEPALIARLKREIGEQRLEIRNLRARLVQANRARPAASLRRPRPDGRGRRPKKGGFRRLSETTLVQRYLGRVWHFGLAHYCPCCRSHLRRFEPCGPEGRDGRCPICRSKPRHRLTYLYIRAKTDLFEGRTQKLLHVAPQPQMSRLFRKAGGIDYLSGDLRWRRAMVAMDVTRIQFPDDTFDAIYCSHVLEHVPEDRKAMRELYRVLKPGGWIIPLVPIEGDLTREDPHVTTPEQRERLYGQHDHVRQYGRDYRDRLAEAGFSVTVDDFARELDARAIRRLGLTPGEAVYFCRKAAA
jgi:hypothetical protein